MIWPLVAPKAQGSVEIASGEVHGARRESTSGFIPPPPPPPAAGAGPLLVPLLCAPIGAAHASSAVIAATAAVRTPMKRRVSMVIRVLPACERRPPVRLPSARAGPW